LKKIAFLFPGQGAQQVGMAQDFYTEFNFVRELFDMAEEITKLNLSRLCFKGPMEELTTTINLQPAVTVVNLAFFEAIVKGGITPNITAGHSLGEYSALCASETLSKEDTFRLVLNRGKLMQRESEKYKGAMAAIIGLPIDKVTAILSEVQKEGIVAMANHNAELQIAITGSPAQVENVSEKAIALGARVVPLNVSGAWHSELIRGAEEEFNMWLGNAVFKAPRIPIILNVTAEASSDPAYIKSIMTKQLFSPVKWYDIMCRLISEDVDIFVEIGPGNVLTGLLKRTLPKDTPCKLYTVNNLKGLEKIQKEIS
jgi:[acyl-carrier-protein] S-malonyltransferase